MDDELGQTVLAHDRLEGRTFQTEMAAQATHLRTQSGILSEVIDISMEDVLNWSNECQRMAQNHKEATWPAQPKLCKHPYHALPKRASKRRSEDASS
jgi:hypothetical protein